METKKKIKNKKELSLKEYIEYLDVIDEYNDWILRHNGDYAEDYWDYGGK